MKKSLRKILSAILKLFPGDTVRFFYRVIFRPAPLRFIVDKTLIALIPEVLEIGEGKLILNRKDAVVSGALMLGIYEPLETKLFREIVRESMNVIDIGANIGYYTAIMARRVGPSGKVFAFEPQPESFSILQRMVDKNNFKNVTCYKLALSDHRGAGKLSGDHYGSQIVNNADTKGAVEIQMATLDEIIAPLRIGGIDIIKMDIEGYEGIALAGMKQTIRKSPKLKLITEFYPALLKNAGVEPISFLEELRNLGFSISEIDERNGQIKAPESDLVAFVQKFTGDAFTNLYCYKE